MSEGTDGDALEWRAEPWRRMMGPLVLVGSGFAALAAYAWWGARDLGWAVAVLLAGAYVVAPLVSPARYRIDRSGVSRRSPWGERRWAWSNFSEVRIAPGDRVAVLRFGGGGWARWKGGVTLFLPDDPLRPRVLERLRSVLPRPRDAS